MKNVVLSFQHASSYAKVEMLSKHLFYEALICTMSILVTTTLLAAQQVSQVPKKSTERYECPSQF